MCCYFYTGDFYDSIVQLCVAEDLEVFVDLILWTLVVLIKGFRYLLLLGFGWNESMIMRVVRGHFRRRRWNPLTKIYWG